MIKTNSTTQPLLLPCEDMCGFPFMCPITHFMAECRTKMGAILCFDIQNRVPTCLQVIILALIGQADIRGSHLENIAWAIIQYVDVRLSTGSTWKLVY